MRAQAAGWWATAGPAPPQPRRSSSRPAPARVATPSGPIVLERRAAGQPAGSGPAPEVDASGQAAGSRSRGGSAWRLAWQQQQQQRQQQRLQGQYGQAQAQQWVLRDGLLLAGPWAVFEGSLASAGGTPALAAASVGAASGTASDSRLEVQLNEPRQRQPLQQGAEQQQQQQQSTSSGGGGGGGGPDPEQQDFFANVGDAIRTLREDYPLLFVKDLNYGIYRDDLTFKDPNLAFHGLKTYRAIFWGLRFHGRLLLKAAHVRVLRIWQPEDAVIKVRWQINATPRLGSPGTFDGISIYRLDRRGRVYQHEVTDVQLRDPPITNPLLYGLNFILSPQPAVQQVPCPGSWFVDGSEEELPEALAAAGASASAHPLLLPTSSADGS